MTKGFIVIELNASTVDLLQDLKIRNPEGRWGRDI